jgi:HD-GYP domain-containing protein (c-di-GMP phosphodiesterase class II)
MALKKISIGKLKIGMNIANPVHTRVNNRMVLLIAENTIIGNEAQIRRLIDAGVRSVIIDTDRGIDTFQSLPAQVTWQDRPHLTGDGEISDRLLENYYNLLITALTAIITRNPTTRLLIADNKVSLVLRGILREIEEKPDLIMALTRLRAVNEFTFAHAMMTSVVCISLANEIGFSYDDTLRFGTGTMLADIGMTSYPSSIIRRPSGLSRSEKEEIQKHPIYSIDFLKYVGVTDKFIHRVILQHHERYNGTGYPYGLTGDEIHATSKLFAITDVYMAMTSPRPQRSGYPPHLVLADILQLAGKLFDPLMVNFFIKHLGVFPIGNMVELTSGRYGIVAAPNKEDPLRPIAIVFETKRKLQTGRRSLPLDTEKTISRGSWELVDLAADGHDFGKIARGIDHRKFRINPSTYLDKV